MKKGFTLVEILVAITIIAILAAIIYPVTVMAKGSASEGKCITQMHGAWLAIEMYRNDNDGGQIGTPSQMGLPLKDLDVNSKLDCLAQQPGPNGRKLYPYINLWQPFAISDSQGIWSRAVTTHGEKTAMLLDINHRNEKTPQFSPYFKRFGIIVRLAGNAQKLERGGDWDLVTTWSP